MSIVMPVYHIQALGWRLSDAASRTSNKRRSIPNGISLVVVYQRARNQFHSEFFESLTMSSEKWCESLAFASEYSRWRERQIYRRYRQADRRARQVPPPTPSRARQDWLAKRLHRRPVHAKCAAFAESSPPRLARQATPPPPDEQTYA